MIPLVKPPPPRTSYDTLGVDGLPQPKGATAITVNSRRATGHRITGPPSLATYATAVTAI
ncbi:MAG TPA: hypothetical protein VKI17_04705 [Gemmataceae bacterium]|nr:hypothetical protein [Gemmataceae bacterium]